MSLYTKDDLVSSEPIFSGNIFSVRKDTLRSNLGEIGQSRTSITREVVEHNGGVVIACQPAANEILLIEQYRYPIDKLLIELPAGRVEFGEDRFLAAKRELTEETGFVASSWKFLAEMYSAPGFCDELLSFYHASDLVFQGKNLDEDEETDVIHVSLKEAWSLVLEGKICDAKTIAGLALLINP